MDKTMILEEAFNVIYDSIEWSFEAKDNEYAYYISGITDLAKNLIDKFAEPTPTKDTECDF